jgi:hypothetical protein
MTDLEQQLRDRFASVPEPALEPSPHLAQRLRRKHDRRRVSVPLGAAAVGVCAAGATAGVASQLRGSGPDRTATARGMKTVASASPSAPATSSTCPPTSFGPDRVREIGDMRWPSGARVATIRGGAIANDCVTVVMLTSQQLDPRDEAAARERWGDAVEVVKLGPGVSTPDE